MASHGEFGSCCPSARAILRGVLPSRQEVQFSAKDRVREGSYGAAAVGRQGHPPNFVGSSIDQSGGPTELRYKGLERGKESEMGHGT